MHQSQYVPPKRNLEKHAIKDQEHPDYDRQDHRHPKAKNTSNLRSDRRRNRDDRYSSLM